MAQIISNHQNEINEISANLGKAKEEVEYQDQEQKESDDIIIERALNATNGEKFKALWEGRWKEVYPDIAARGQGPSEADQALVNIIAFYSKNDEQVYRLFLQSGLGKRDKIKKRPEYVWKMIRNARDNQFPDVDYKGCEAAIEKLNGHKSSHLIERTSIPWPPGLLGEIAYFIYTAVPRPVPEIAIAAAIALMAGICGRAYNISGTGLNQYILILAKTGSGKEGAAQGIDKLMNAVQPLCDNMSARYRGPGMIASGQALAKHFKESKCFVSVIGEFAIRMEAMSHKDALASEKMLLALMLDLYNKSGKGQMLHGNIYSKKEDSVGIIESPAFTLLGESTPDRFYTCINEQMIGDGLLPRFLLIEYNGKRPPFNENHHLIQPPSWLVNKLVDLVKYVETKSFNNEVNNIERSDEAAQLLREFNVEADDKINNTDKEIISELWNRAHMKVLKLSGLVSVGVDYINPLVIADHFHWAKHFVKYDIEAITKKFYQGDIGGNTSAESKQVKEVIRVIKEYFMLSPDKIKSYRIKQELFDQRIIPWAYISRRLHTLPTFISKNSKMNPTDAMKHAVNVLIDRNELRERNNLPIKSSFGGKEISFEVIDPKIFDE